jgi:hypothetical protein
MMVTSGSAPGELYGDQKRSLRLCSNSHVNPDLPGDLIGSFSVVRSTGKRRVVVVFYVQAQDLIKNIDIKVAVGTSQFS